MTNRKLKHKRIRKKVHGTAKKPRLCIYRSTNRIYAQLVNDEQGTVLTATAGKKGIASAKKVGKDIASKAKKLKIDNCVFDRAGYKYHGNVKSLAEGAREGGLKF